MSNHQIFGERRRYQRKPCAFSVTIDDHKRAYSVMMRNLSLGGALIDPPGNRRPKKGQEFIITIPYQLKKDNVVIKGKIERIEAAGVGVTFLKGEI